MKMKVKEMPRLKNKIIYSVFIPLFLVTYVLLAGIGKLTLNSGEIFPFFSWSLFSGFHEKAPHYMVQIHSVDGQEDFDIPDYVSSNNHPDKIRVEKAIMVALRQCKASPKSLDCEMEIRKKVVPMLKRIYPQLNITFSAVLCTYDFEFVKQQFQKASNTVPMFDRDNCKTEVISGPWSTL